MVLTEWTVLCYYSRKFNKNQLRYSTIEKETLALLLALQYFEVYVGSSSLPVVVYTDHNHLVFLSRMYRTAYALGSDCTRLLSRL